jgi:hypothetical protein
MAKTLAPAIIEELRRLKINAPPTPAFEKLGGAGSAFAAEKRIAEIDGRAHAPADARDSCPWRDRGPGPAVWRLSPAQSAD